MENIKIIINGPFSFNDILDKKNPIFNEAGVYLWTFPHKNKFYPVYVGETDDFHNRFSTYKGDFKNSKSYFVLPKENDDLYSLLGGQNKQHYNELYEKRKFWYPKQITNSESWVSDSSQLYKDKLKIFLLVQDKTNTGKLDKKERQCLQTQIQRSLRYVHGIKYYEGDKQSWLGLEDRVSNNEYLECTFNLINIPEKLDPVSSEVLNNLSEFARGNTKVQKK